MEILSQEQIIGILIYQKTLKTGFTDQEQKKDIIAYGRINRGEKSVSISQTVKLPAGTYKLGIKSTGAAGGLKLSAGEYVSTDLKASEWADDQSKWESIETGEFTLDKESDVKVFVSGKLTAWNKGSALMILFCMKKKQMILTLQKKTRKATQSQ